MKTTRSQWEMILIGRVEELDRLTFLVQSDHDPDVWYVVDLEEGTCNCTDATARKVECKHQMRAIFYWARKTLRKIKRIANESRRKRTSKKTDSAGPPHRDQHDA